MRRELAAGVAPYACSSDLRSLGGMMLSCGETLWLCDERISSCDSALFGSCANMRNGLSCLRVNARCCDRCCSLLAWRQLGGGVDCERGTKPDWRVTTDESLLPLCSSVNARLVGLLAAQVFAGLGLLLPRVQSLPLPVLAYWEGSTSEDSTGGCRKSWTVWI